MCSKRLGPQGEVGDTVVFERIFVSPTPSVGWDRVGTTGEVGTVDRSSLHEAERIRRPYDPRLGCSGYRWG